MGALRDRKPVDYSQGHLEKAAHGASGTPGWLAASKQKSRAGRRVSVTESASKENAPPAEMAFGKRTDKADVTASTRLPKPSGKTAAANKKALILRQNGSSSAQRQVGKAVTSKSGKTELKSVSDSAAVQMHKSTQRDKAAALKAATASKSAGGEVPALCTDAQPTRVTKAAQAVSTHPAVVSLITPGVSNAGRKRTSCDGRKPADVNKRDTKRRKTTPAAAVAATATSVPTPEGMATAVGTAVPGWHCCLFWTFTRALKTKSSHA